MGIERADVTGIVWASPWCPDRYDNGSLFIIRYGHRDGRPGFRQRIFYRGKPTGRQEWRNLIDDDQLRSCIEQEPAMSPNNPEKWAPVNAEFRRVRP